MGIRARIAALAAELESIRTEIAELDAVEEPTEEQVARAEELVGTWDTAKGEHDRLVERAEKLDAIRTAALDPANVEPAFAAPQVMVKRDAFADLESVQRNGLSPADVRARALTAIEDTARESSPARMERATELAQVNAGIARHILLTGSPSYRSAFEKFLRHPESFQALLEPDEQAALRTAMSTTAGNGGYALPWLLDPTVILTNNGSANPFRQIARVETGTTNKWNGLSSAGVTASWKGEGSAVSDASPTFAQPSVTALLGSAYIIGSYEVMEDTDIAGQLPALIADAKDRLEEAAFATGAGSTTAPKGIVTAVTAVTASRVTPTTGGTFSAASEVYNVANAIPARHASRASWVANKTVYNLIRQFDTYGGGSFWTDLGMGTPSQLLGQPVYESSTMTATVTTGSNILLAGDFAEYLIYDRAGVTLEYIPNVVDGSGLPTGQRGFHAWWRTGADVLNANAFRVLLL